jgi:hypothetical protein
MQLVPPELRFGKTPCRQIQLNTTGDTLDSLYRWGDQQDIEKTLRNWLIDSIAKLEDRRKVRLDTDIKRLPAKGQVTKGVALYQNLHAKCANPACPTTFHWLEGGKFFRFRPDSSATESANNRQDVKHFWLCEHCSHIFTLVYDGQHGVVLTLRYLEFPLTEVGKELPTSRPN